MRKITIVSCSPFSMCYYWGWPGRDAVLAAASKFQRSKCCASLQITFAYVFIYAWSVCIIKFSIIALYRRIFGMTLLGWWCVFLTTGYLITNHVVLPLYTRPLSYYWDQWYPGTRGVVLVDEAKVRLRFLTAHGHSPSPSGSTNSPPCKLPQQSHTPLPRSHS